MGMSLTGYKFQPDLAIIKSRSNATDWAWYDSIRGVQKRLESNTADAEVVSDDGVTAFNADGITLGNLAQVRTTGSTYVSYMFKKGVTPGFDIVSYVGTGVARTVAHGLGAIPEFFICKSRDGSTQSWIVYHKDHANSGQKCLVLDSTSIGDDDPAYWNDTAPTSSVFTVGTYNGTNQNTKNLIAYLFSSVPGFSKFGSYVGNGSADGPFIHCGFRPKMIVVKRIDSTGNWHILDAARELINPVDVQLTANNPNSESGANGYDTDFVSNGWKIRNTYEYNTSSATYVYAAWAEAPAKYSRAR